MGCIVNGPGEMADADYGYVGAAAGRITLYKGREVVERNIPQEQAIERLVDRYAESRADDMGSVGEGARISNVKFIREVRIGRGAAIEGASSLECGTVAAGAYVGATSKLRSSSSTSIRT